MRLTVETRSKSKFNTLLAFLKSNGYKVQVQGKSAIPDEDWCMPGRTANEEEVEHLAMVMEKETGGEETRVVFDRIIRKYSK